jgi:CheY-like chemotaxis protein
MILFVDDDKREMDSYVRELEWSGHTVEFKSKVDPALQFLDENQVELLILDIMMPSGEAFKDVNTDSGLDTGLHFYKKVRDKYPNLSIMIFTNRSDKAIENNFSKDARCRFFRKEKFLPFEFAEEVSNILQH